MPDKDAADDGNRDNAGKVFGVKLCKRCGQNTPERCDGCLLPRCVECAAAQVLLGGNVPRRCGSCTAQTLSQCIGCGIPVCKYCAPDAARAAAAARQAKAAASSGDMGARKEEAPADDNKHRRPQPSSARQELQDGGVGPR